MAECSAQSAYSVLITSSPEEKQRRHLTAKLRAMQALEQGWSFGEGDQVSSFAAQIGETLVLIACYAGVKADVFPNLDGGCAVAAYTGDSYKVEVSIRPQGRLDLRVESGYGFDFKEVEAVDGISMQIFQRYIERLRPTLWKSSGFLTSASSIPTSAAFATPPSGTLLPLQAPTLQMAAAGSQLLTQPAPATK